MFKPAQRVSVLPLVALAAVLAATASRPDASQPKPAARVESPQTPVYDASVFAALRWRSIGPNRGGRSLAAAGSPSRPNEYYFGAVGGGLWKTTDGGAHWAPVTDGQIRSSSVGAVAVASSNPDIVYVGMGEVQLRGNVMQGDGVYRSSDGGTSWTHIGLADTHAIGRIRVDPANPDIVYVAALGHPYGANAERGVFRTRDGGKTWQKILFRSDRAGAVDLCLDPRNPRVLYAAIWEVYRTPWLLWSGGEGSGLFQVQRRRRYVDGADAQPRPAEGLAGEDRRRGVGSRLRARLRAGRSRGWWPLPVGRCGRDVDEGEREPRPAPARVLLLPDLRRPRQPRRRLRTELPVPPVD